MVLPRRTRQHVHGAAAAPGGLALVGRSLRPAGGQGDDRDRPGQRRALPGFQLGSLWYISLDYVNHQTSLTRRGTNRSRRQDPHGDLRAIPGRQLGRDDRRRRGILQFRWQRTDDPIGVELGPTAEVVDLDEVAARLPFYDENRIDEQGWAARIAARQRAFARRMLA